MVNSRKEECTQIVQRSCSQWVYDNCEWNQIASKCVCGWMALFFLKHFHMPRQAHRLVQFFHKAPAVLHHSLYMKFVSLAKYFVSYFESELLLSGAVAAAGALIYAPSSLSLSPFWNHFHFPARPCYAAFSWVQSPAKGHIIIVKQTRHAVKSMINSWGYSPFHTFMKDITRPMETPSTYSQHSSTFSHL